MKRLLIVIFTLILYTGCETDFSINSEWKDITIVYGLLDQSSTTNYIRINKAFLGEGDAMMMAKQYDTLNYGKGSIDVIIEEYNTNNQKLNSYNLIWDTLRKQEGVFFDANYPYQNNFRLDAKINSNNKYRLIVKNNKNGKTVVSETNLVSDFSLRWPTSVSSFTYSGNINWVSAKNGTLYQVLVRLYYSEKDINNTDLVTEKYVEWILPSVEIKDISGTKDMTLHYNSDQLFFLTANRIGDNNNYIRKGNRVEFTFEIGSENLNNYININKPSTSVVQQKPEFSNIENGIGIFASKFTKKIAVKIGTASMDSLINGRFTKHLSFKTALDFENY